MNDLKQDLKQVGRLSLRVEGSLWVAYYALPDTLEGAIYLGSVQMRFVQNEERKKTFVALMREAVGDLFEEQMGLRPEWPDGEQPAPEHERSGSA